MNFAWRSFVTENDPDFCYVFRDLSSIHVSEGLPVRGRRKEPMDDLVSFVDDEGCKSSSSPTTTRSDAEERLRNDDADGTGYNAGIREDAGA